MDQRQLKFRAWDKKFKRWFEPGNKQMEKMALRLDGRVVLLPYIIMDGEKADSGNEVQYRFIIQQFTGLLDCKGKEIYEGDIVRDINGPTLIGATEPLRFTWVIRWCSGDDASVMVPGFCISVQAAPTVEVIGNIFENKSLLEAKP